MSDEPEWVPSAPFVEMFPVPDSGIPESSVPEPDTEIEVPDPRVGRVPDVQIAGGGVEIRAEAAHLVIEILEGWLKQQNRRIDVIRRGGIGREERRSIQELQARIGVVYRLVETWERAVQEGVLTVPEEDSEID